MVRQPGEAVGRRHRLHLLVEEAVLERDRDLVRDHGEHLAHVLAEPLLGARDERERADRLVGGEQRQHEQRLRVVDLDLARVDRRRHLARLAARRQVVAVLDHHRREAGVVLELEVRRAASGSTMPSPPGRDADRRDPVASRDPSRTARSRRRRTRRSRRPRRTRSPSPARASARGRASRSPGRTARARTSRARRRGTPARPARRAAPGALASASRSRSASANGASRSAARMPRRCAPSMIGTATSATPARPLS